LLDLLGDTRSAKRSSLLAPVKLLGDQSLVPAQEGVWSRDVRNRFETFAAEGIGQRGETAAFGVGQAQPAPAELGFEEAVFHEEIRDDLLLVTVDPPSEHGEQQLEDHGLSSSG
jgi:hypothetical protein